MSGPPLPSAENHRKSANVTYEMYDGGSKSSPFLWMCVICTPSHFKPYQNLNRNFN